jgi:prepilin-type N-terminal cleavage/methylation domain-containing protein
MMDSTTLLRRARGQRGFSFIEILVVMGIIGVLVGGVVVAINLFFKKGPEFNTRNTLNKVKAITEKWRMTFDGMYPPSDVARIAEIAQTGTAAKAPGNSENAGIEALYQAFYWPGFGTDPGLTDSEIDNVDEDELAKAVNKLGTKPLYEIVDGWGNPLIYFTKDDYAKYASTGASYHAKDPDTADVETVEAMPYRRDDGSYVNPTSFQLFSMGPDARPNTPDDITIWGD